MIEVEKIEINTQKLEKFANSQDISTDLALKETAYQVEGLAENKAPVRTGALKNSIHTEKVSHEDYRVADGVEYGIYQELGTYKMAAHPFLIPALKTAIQQIYDAVAREFEKVLK